jgi:hypothetical protein
MTQKQESTHALHRRARSQAQDATPRDHGCSGRALRNATKGAAAAKKRNMKIKRRRPGVGPNEKARSSNDGANEMRTTTAKSCHRYFAEYVRTTAEDCAKRTGVAIAV